MPHPQSQATGTLYLIPTTLGDTEPTAVLPADNARLVTSIRFFIVENIRTARRFLKKINREIDIDSLTFFELNEHTAPDEIGRMLEPLTEGHHMGILSEAGCPAIADPGADAVAIAQRRGIRVVPLVGPSSILLALMASGFNGQRFAFEGYLPIKQGERAKALKRMENRIYSEDQTQIFIETPYRNMKMLDDILAVCHPKTLLCVAADITLPTQWIRTLPLTEWRATKPDLNKRPAIFLLYK